MVTAGCQDYAGVAVPTCGETHEELAAFYSGFAFCEMYRKVVLAQCKEVLRAGASLTNQKLTETRLDDLARIHPAYLAYLTTHLQGRIRWEQAFLAQGGMR